MMQTVTHKNKSNKDMLMCNLKPSGAQTAIVSALIEMHFITTLHT